jgi:hypothetical protein
MAIHFFLEHAGELHIIALRRRELKVQHIRKHITQHTHRCIHLAYMLMSISVVPDSTSIFTSLVMPLLLKLPIFM